MTYIHRSLESVVTQASEWFPVILITGSRQVGKTTMLRHLMQGSTRSYVTLDDLTERSLAKKDPDLFLQTHKTPILIDEVQYAPELFSAIKRAADSGAEPGSFWLTGSEAFSLMKGINESMAGRVAVLSLTSISQAELARAPQRPFAVNRDWLRNRAKERKPCDINALYEMIFRGSMPAVIQGAPRDLFYSSYISTYIERDVKGILERVDVLKFHRFTEILAARTSQLVNFAAVAQEAEILQKQAKEWIDILRMFGIVFLLRPYSNNLLKRLVKTPKLYFFDTGLVCHLTRWSSPEVLQAGAMNGAILENYAVAEVVKTYLGCGKEPPVFFFRNKDKKEVDLLLEQNGEVNPIKIKRTANPGTELTGVFSLLDNASVKRGQGAVLCLKPDVLPLDARNCTVPIWAI